MNLVGLADFAQLACPVLAVQGNLQGNLQGNRDGPLEEASRRYSKHLRNLRGGIIHIYPERGQR